MTVEAYDFGQILIDGKPYRSDVVIWPDRVDCPWWRAEGHSLVPDDLPEVLASPPAQLIIGTGFYGRLQVPDETLATLQELGIQVRIAETRLAVAELNRLREDGADVVAALHLTC